MSIARRTPKSGPSPSGMMLSSLSPSQPADGGSGPSTNLNRRSMPKSRQANEPGSVRNAHHNEEDEENDHEISATARSIRNVGRGVPPRSWTVSSVTGRRDSKGLLKYTVRWDPSTHPTSSLQTDFHNGHQRLYVEGRPWRVESLDAVEPVGGLPHTRVRWKSTVHPVWELSSACDTLADYDRHHPTPGKPLDFQRWSLYIQNVQDPEVVSDADVHGTIDDDVFVPRQGIDYTQSLLHRSKKQLKHAGLKNPSVLQQLNMPRRQKLTFSNSFTESGRTWDLSQDIKFRATFVHIAGHSQSSRCSRCVEKGGVFDKCVTSRDVFAGACTNCAVAGRGTSCEYHNKLEWRKDILPDAVEEEEDEVDDPADAQDATQDAVSNMSALRLVDNAAAQDVTVLERIQTASAASRIALPARKPVRISGSSVPQASSPSRRKRDRDAGDGEEDLSRPTKRRDSGVSAAQGAYPSPPPVEGIDTMYHLKCRVSGRHCIDPNVGFLLPENLTDYKRFIVFNDEVFGKGELTTEQVKFIISCSPCGLALKLDQGWDDVRSLAGMTYVSRWRYFSDLYYDLLGTAIKRYCPFRPNTIIDLSEDD
ncbi:unnamed protein product [Zymoseptoria tritici ST99CH_3D7]|uniref:Uncharacterized protein n=1 Tax=Zymoseptoria tritici (strain ST99CH_3D7) TaxID=1276538 RepID=A0A1X7RZH8_ZYMT9|nr:unnamed protein product [Zymoseptoria tritici ST99CH_3D7]